jgi:uncharacterized protein
MHQYKLFTLIVSLLIATALWIQMFFFKFFPFWYSMGISTFILILIALYLGGKPFRKTELSIINVTIGIIAAFFLYGIFAIGNILLRFIFNWGPNGIDQIYHLKGSLSRTVILLILIFPIGSGEEIFWRGYIQNKLSRLINPFYGYLLTSLIYASIHLISGNPVLFLAALICGLFWGFIYLWRKSVVPSLISHVLWDITVFILFPFTQ